MAYRGDSNDPTGAGVYKTVGISSRADYIAEELDARIMEWSGHLTNIDGVFKSYVELHPDFADEKASVLATMYLFYTELQRARNEVVPFYDLYWDEEGLVNTEIKRLEDVRAAYAAESERIDDAIALLDVVLDAGQIATLEGYQSTVNTNAGTSETYRNTVKTDADAAFGLYEGTPAVTTDTASGNYEFEDLLDDVVDAFDACRERVGIKEGLTDTAVALLNYFDTFVRLTESGESVDKLDDVTFISSEYQSVSNNLVGLDVGTGSANYTDVDGNEAVATYPVLNTPSDHKTAIVTTYLNAGVSPKYYNDPQAALSSMTSQISSCKSTIEAQYAVLQGLPTATQQARWYLYLTDIETARTQYSSWTYTNVSGL